MYFPHRVGVASQHPRECVIVTLRRFHPMVNKMNAPIYALPQTILASLLLFLMPVSASTEDDCQPYGDYQYVCGPQSAEDLVLVPSTRFIIASGYASEAPFYLIDSQQKSWSALLPTDMSKARQNKESFSACPGKPDTNNLVTHGLHIRASDNGHSTLYVVGHGGREAIEVFDVNTSGTEPVLTWTGCVMTPDAMEANSVTSLRDGSLLITIPLEHGKTLGDAMARALTGSVYAWAPGDKAMTIVQGTELPYGNGIEVSADEKEFYVASTGLSTVIAYSNTNPAKVLRTTSQLAFVPDNLHMGPGGTLITAGLVADYPSCGTIGGEEKFDLAKFAACPRPFIVKAINPKTMETTDIAKSPAHTRFSNITMGLIVEDELWIGTFSGDRIAFRSLH